MHNPNEVEEATQVVDEDEETENDYLLARHKSRRVIKLPQRRGYAYLIAFALISASEVLDEKHIKYKEHVRSRNKTE